MTLAKRIRPHLWAKVWDWIWAKVGAEKEAQEGSVLIAAIRLSPTQCWDADSVVKISQSWPSLLLSVFLTRLILPVAFWMRMMNWLHRIDDVWMKPLFVQKGMFRLTLLAQYVQAQEMCIVHCVEIKELHEQKKQIHGSATEMDWNDDNIKSRHKKQTRKQNQNDEEGVVVEKRWWHLQKPSHLGLAHQSVLAARIHHRHLSLTWGLYERGRGGAGSTYIKVYIYISHAQQRWS